MNPQKEKRWSKQQDEKILSLFEKQVSRGGISSEDLSKKTIANIVSKFFPERTYSNFAPLFRRKAREYNLNKSLTGLRAVDAKEDDQGNFKQ